jgi:hypothetical protein
MMKHPLSPCPIFHLPSDSPKYSPFIITQTAGHIDMQRPFRLSVRAPGVDQAFGCCLVRMVIRLTTDGRVARKWSVCHRAEGFPACGTRSQSDSPFNTTKLHKEQFPQTCSEMFWQLAPVTAACKAPCSWPSDLQLLFRVQTLACAPAIMTLCVRDLPQLLHPDAAAVPQTTHDRILPRQLWVIIRRLIVWR